MRPIPVALCILLAVLACQAPPAHGDAAAAAAAAAAAQRGEAASLAAETEQTKYSSKQQQHDDKAVLKQLRIAVVGGGIGGSTVAHLTSKLIAKHRAQLGAKYDDISITLLESAPRLCGRVMSKFINGSAVEIGAAIYHVSNEILYNLTDEFGLKRLKAFDDDGFGIWNGSEFVFATSTFRNPWIKYIHTVGKVLLRYGLAPFDSSGISSAFLKNFAKLYNTTFESVEELLQVANIDHLARTSMAQWVKDNHFSAKFAREIVEGATRINYGQNLGMSALGAWVSMVGSEESVFAIDGGNEQLCYKMAGVDRDQVLHGVVPTTHVKNGIISTLLQARVASVSKYKTSDEGSKYVVEYDHQGGRVSEDYDIVVIATPLEATAIKFNSIDVKESTTRRRAYHDTYVTIVHGEVNPAYFGKASANDVPATVLTLEPSSRAFTADLHPASGATTAQVPFSSFSLLHRKQDLNANATRFLGIYKFFSPLPLADSQIEPAFKSVLSVFRHVFAAYPVLVPFEKDAEFPSLRVEKNLYYLNAIESAASAMEMETLAALSISKMIYASL